MNRFQKWLLRKLLKKAIKTHTGNKTLFSMIWLESKNRFYEDNAATRLKSINEYLDAQLEQELKLAKLYKYTLNYVKIHNSNPERVYRYGKISCPMD